MIFSWGRGGREACSIHTPPPSQQGGGRVRLLSHLFCQEISFPLFSVQFSFSFLLLVSCFYTLPFQIVLFTSSSGGGRRDIRRYVGGRVYTGLLSFFIILFLGIVSPEALLRGMFHSSPFLTSGWVKKQYRCPWLVCQPMVKLLLLAEDEVLFLSMYNSCFPGM